MHEDLNEFENVLRSLTPASKPVNPVAAAFDAGHTNGRKSVHRWQAAAGLVLLLGIAAQWRPTATPHDSSLARSPIASIPESIDRPSEQTLFMLQNVVSERGLNALPRNRLAPLKATRIDDTL